jgi:hypothetical protein
MLGHRYASNPQCSISNDNYNYKNVEAWHSRAIDFWLCTVLKLLCLVLHYSR